MPESRAEYFRELRKKKKQLVFMIEKDDADKLDSVLHERGEGRTEWFRRIVAKEIGKEK